MGNQPIPVTLELGNFPSGYCWPGPSQFASDLVGLITANVQSGYSPVYSSSTVPPVNAQNAVWFKLDQYGNPVGQFVYINGQWVWPLQPFGPSDPRIQFVQCAESQVWTLDGGDGTIPNDTIPSSRASSVVAPTATTGAMWQVNYSLQFAFPMFAGTSPTTYPEWNGGVADTVAVGATSTGAGQAGESRHYLAPLEEALHAHFIGRRGWHVSGTDDNSSFSMVAAQATDGSSNSSPNVPNPFLVGAKSDGTPASGVASTLDLATSLQAYLSGGNYVATQGMDGASGNAPKSHNTLPPFSGFYGIVRTARIYLVGG